MKRWTWCSLFLLATGVVAAPREGDVERRTGLALAEDGASMPYEVGAIWVPENRAVAGSRLIKVGFARIAARTPTGAPPVFWLPGGPGLAVLDDLDDPGVRARKRVLSWLRLAATADLIVVEQRGYSSRGERLVTQRPAYPLARPLTSGDAAAMARRVARQALREQRGRDLAGYTLAACADDVDAVRRALGYQRIALFGGSFGSQWSLALMQQHPQTVVRALLFGIHPPAHRFDMPTALLATLQRIAAEADRDPALAPWMPPGGLMAAAEAVRARLARRNAAMTFADAGQPAVTIVAGEEDFLGDLLYAAGEPASWPAFVLSLYHGHDAAWLRGVVDDRRTRTVKLIAPLIDVSLGVTPERLQRLGSERAVPLIGASRLAPHLAAADIWPSAHAGALPLMAAPSPIPVLMIQGDWDTTTPLEGMLEQLPRFPNGHAMVAHRGGHEGAFQLVRGHDQLKDALFAFLRSGSLDGLPSEIVLASPAFILPDFPPPPRTAVPDTGPAASADWDRGPPAARR